VGLIAPMTEYAPVVTHLDLRPLMGAVDGILALELDTLTYAEVHAAHQGLLIAATRVQVKLGHEPEGIRQAGDLLLDRLTHVIDAVSAWASDPDDEGVTMRMAGELYALKAIAGEFAPDDGPGDEP
jgi:hypothetical protein